MSTINEFPWQESILRRLRTDGTNSVDDVVAAVGAGDAGREAVGADLAHLADIGLVERHGDEVRLTAEGTAAAARLP
ncbi:MAG TPA: hypothetical protein VGL44_02175 [Gaiellales bacterium]|jgi:coproporphyrinogen III oxidase-like Fe-S oxidoreductase